jgi:hypothetical protein
VDGAAAAGIGTIADPAAGHTGFDGCQLVSDGDFVGARTGTDPVGTAAPPGAGTPGAADTNSGYERTPATRASTARVDVHHRGW